MSAGLVMRIAADVTRFSMLCASRRPPGQAQSGARWQAPVGINDERCCSRRNRQHHVANATWLACIANHTVIPAKAGTYAAWVPAFAGMTILCGVCYIMPEIVDGGPPASSPRQASPAMTGQAAPTSQALGGLVSGGWNQVSRDRHAAAPCMSRDRARRVWRARQRGRPGAGGITEQPRRTSDDIPTMERNAPLRECAASCCEASRCEASRCEPPCAAAGPAPGLAWADAAAMRRACGVRAGVDERKVRWRLRAWRRGGLIGPCGGRGRFAL